VATVASTAYDEGVSVKVGTRLARAQGVTVNDAYGATITGPQATALANGLKSGENCGRPDKRRR